MKVVEGEILPIELQIENNNSTKFPQAILRNELNSIIGTVNLSHIDDGLYKPSVNFSMTSAKFIAVQYLIYDDAARTIISTDVGSATEIFIRESVHEITWDEPILDHQIPGTTGETLSILETLDLEEILSKIIISDITARVESDDKLGFGVESNEIVVSNTSDDYQVFAVIGEAEEISSNINENEIIGVINEC